MPVREPFLGTIPALNAQVTGLRFFESGFDVPSADSRVYSGDFSNITARFINWAVSLEYPAQTQDRDFDIDAVYFRPNGGIFGSQTLETNVEKGWDGSIHNWGRGWREPGKWVPGEYWVELSFDGKLIAAAGFEIVDGVVLPRLTTPVPTRAPTETLEPLMTYGEVIDLVQPSIVRLSTVGSRGSGFIIRTLENSAYVATNEHVVDDAGATVTAMVGDKALYPGLVIGKDDRYDLAVVWICCSEDFQSLPLAESGSYVTGDEIGAFGYPLGATVMQATWGNFDKVEPQPDENGWDMENRPLNLAGGNSGGPIVDLRGQVIGINAGSVTNQPYANGVSAQVIRERLPLLIGDHSPDRRNWPAIDWKSGVSVTHDGLFKLDVTVRQSSFVPCDTSTPIGQSCKPNVLVYRNGSHHQSVFGYYCGEDKKGTSTWCIDSSSEQHFYYPSSGRLAVTVLTNLSAPRDDTRWDVCIHSNTEERPLLGCAPIQWKSR